MTRRLGAALAAVVLGCGACGSSAGLHLEQGGRTVPVGPVPPATVPPRPPHLSGAGILLGGPGAIAYFGGTLWCAVQPNAGTLVGSLVRVDTASGRIAAAPVPLPAAADPYLLAVGDDGPWLAAGTRLWRIDPTGGAVRAAVTLPGAATAILDAQGSVWVTVMTAAGGSLLRLDPATGRLTGRARTGPHPAALTVSGGSTWVADAAAQSLLQVGIAPARLRRQRSIPFPRAAGAGPSQVTVYAGLVWVYEPGRVFRIDPATGAVAGTTPVAAVPGGTLAAGSGGIWVITETARRRRAEVVLLDAATGAPTGRGVVVGGRPAALATDGSSVWVYDSAAGRLLRVAS